MGHTSRMMVAPHRKVTQELVMARWIVVLTLLAVGFAVATPGLLRLLLESGVLAAFVAVLLVYALFSFIRLVSNFIEKLD